MGVLYADVDDKIEEEFRAAAVAVFGAKKGFVKKGLEEALKDWTEQHKRKGS